ncbi:MAG: polyprenyl synthetase family protein [Candidatus Moranbacteria bacterium]|nr:polyprenyl synthetase family protein [Candidatus Moranbacteria bacterium]
MDAKKSLAEFKKEIDVEIEEYLDKVIRESRKRDALTTETLRHVKKIVLAGGKRLRPALMYWGYIAAGGRERKKIIKTAVSIELIHLFLLIHDDIIDRDCKRHGINTINFEYEKLGKKLFPGSDSKHFGNSVAIIVGDMVGALGNQIIFNSGFSSRLIMKALSRLQSIVSLTVVGQAKDIYLEYRRKASEKEILEMYEYKTAKYTMEGPLHLGAILGGGDEKILQGLNKFAVPVGIAFQIQDDILGVFGSEKKLGKAVGSDIQEGKQTLLVVKAKEKGSQAQRKKISELLGKNDITLKDIRYFQEIVKDTGSLEYAQNLAKKLILQGKRELEKIEVKKEAREFLAGIAEYMVSREI